MGFIGIDINMYLAAQTLLSSWYGKTVKRPQKLYLLGREVRAKRSKVR